MTNSQNLGQKQPYLTITRNAFKKDEKHPDLRGYITLHEPLPAGTYEIGLYGKMSQKQNKIYSGVIRPKLEKKIEPHFQEREEEDDESEVFPF